MVLFGASVYSVVAPEKYKSSTKILVVPQRVPEAYVHSTVSTQIEDRLSTIQQQVLSRTRLAIIIEDLGLFREQKQKVPLEHTGLQDIRKLAEAGAFNAVARKGTVIPTDISARYREHLLTYVDRPSLKPLKIVSNPGNDGAGLVIDLIEDVLPFQFIKVHHEPDDTFPDGVPNPMIEANRAPTVAALLANRADLGIAFDGDFDRCFFFDEQGTFIEGYYIVGLLASMFLKRNPGGRIVHDPRLTWNTLEIVRQARGASAG